MSEIRPVRRALVSVSDKTGLGPFAKGLAESGVSIVSSGGTARALADEGIAVTPVEEVTGFPEMLGGRVKTLHPVIHAGILADRGNSEHLEQLAARGIEPFDLVVVNLYPFRETVESGADPETVVENIDIGGPAMVRAAAKNHASVGVVVRPERYGEVLAEIREKGGLAADTRRILAGEAYTHTAAYDAAIATWFASRAEEDLPPFVAIAYEKQADLRYGENPHQRGALYREAEGQGVLGGARVLQGKDMSFNNWLDVEAAYSLAADFDEGAVVIVKHNNPCGVAVGDDMAAAFTRAFESDTVSAFGGIVAFNREVGPDAAAAMAEVFTEAIVAPGFDEGASATFAKRENLRLVQAPLRRSKGLDLRVLAGGSLVQDRDTVDEAWDAMTVASKRKPTDEERRDLLFAWKVAARTKSNAIVFAKDSATVGIGAGQMSRVDSSVLAVRKAGERAKGAVMASDAFFPFPDALEVAAEAGVTAVIHPGGSVRDEEVLRAAESYDMAVVVTGRRHFRH
ncbi:MAG: bifunctional phosphoribosylaminoimidazolecarboxamide formyltransferase/IMP cyclohydrolase [Actinomycetota bacterium]